MVEVEYVGYPGEDAVSSVRYKPGLATGVASTGVLMREMRRSLEAGTASTVVSTGT